MAQKKTAARKPPKTNSESPQAFADLLEMHGLHGSEPAPLADFAFFLGAGFSKAWDKTFPTGDQLFRATSNDRSKRLANAERAANFFGLPPQLELTPDHVRQLVYSLDMNMKYPVFRSRYADDESLRIAVEQMRTFFCTRLQSLVGDQWNWFDESCQEFAFKKVFTPAQEQIIDFFSNIFDLIDGSHGHMQGARYNFITTNYDWNLEYILAANCPEDFAFSFLYRGITPSRVCGQVDIEPAFEHSLAFNLLKLNGGCEIFRENDRYHFDYRRRDAEEYLDNPPVLMLPSREQNYQDHYFLSIFPKAVRLLQESVAMILVGYSLPDDDALLRFIIKHFCEDEADAHKKQIFYIDTATEEVQLERLKSVFPFANKTLSVHTYSGCFARWAKEVSQLL